MLRLSILFLFITSVCFAQSNNTTGTISNGESGVSVRSKLNEDINKGNAQHDSLAVHLDTLQAHRVDINANTANIITNTTNISVNTDSITVHRTNINNNIDSLAIHLDTLQVLRTDINSGLGGATTDTTDALRVDINTNAASIVTNSDSITIHRIDINDNIDTLVVHRTDINRVLDSLGIHLDSLQALSLRININTDSITAHRTDINNNTDSIDAKIALDETYRLSVIGPEGEVLTTDTIVVKTPTGEVKTILDNLFASLYVTINIETERINTLEDSITALRTAISVLELESEFDSIRVNSTIDTVFGYFPTATGQVILPWVVLDPQDLVAPTFVSAEVGTYNDGIIVITMSEHLLADSIKEYSGGAGGVFSGMDAAYNFDQETGDLLDQVGSDDGTNNGAYQLDSLGVGDKAWYFDGGDYVLLGTGINYGSNDLSGSVHIKPHSLASDFRIYSAESNGFFIYYDAGNNGLGAGKADVDITTTTTIDLTVNDWNHVCWSYDQTANQVTFWIDGVSEVEAYSTEFSGVSNYIGSSKAPDSYFTGLMDDLFLFDGEKMDQNRVDSLATSRYNESGGSQSINTDTITAAFTVTSTPARTIDTVWIVANKIYLDLDADVTYGDPVTVTYDRPTGAGLARGVRDTTDNYTLDFGPSTVTNNVDTATFEIYETFDFETETADTWTVGEQNAYWTAVAGGLEDATPDWSNLLDITVETIDGKQTKVCRFTLPAAGDEGNTDGLYGYEANVNLSGNYSEVYLAYRFKYDATFQWTEGGKQTGLRGQPKLNDPFSSPFLEPYEGFWEGFHFKQGGRLNFYVRDRTKSWGVPWAIEEADYVNSFYVNNGAWNWVVERLVMNTFIGGVAQYDGIIETWINGVMVHQKDDMRFKVTQGNDDVSGLLLHSFYGGDYPSRFAPNTTTYTYIDSIVLYRPLNDDTWGTTDLHSTSATITSPIDITDMTAVYDTKITSAGTLTNSEYGGTYSGLIDETWLIEAGVGETITLTFDAGTLGGEDYIIMQDGQNANSSVLGVIDNSTSDYSSELGGDGAVTSTGRWMLVTFRTDNNNHATGFSATITFN